MSDQAHTLRVLRGGKQPEATLPKQRRAFEVTGGPGGLGKSTVAVNLAVAYAQLGAKTLMLDTDLGMADLNLLLGVAPEKSLLDALGGADLQDVLVQAHGIELLPALNGSYLLSTLGPAGLEKIMSLVESLANQFDTLVVDVAAGIGQVQTMFAGSASDAVVVVNPALVGAPLLVHAPESLAARVIRQLANALGSLASQPTTWWRARAQGVSR